MPEEVINLKRIPYLYIIFIPLPDYLIHKFLRVVRIQNKSELKSIK